MTAAHLGMCPKVEPSVAPFWLVLSNTLAGSYDGWATWELATQCSVVLWHPFSLLFFGGCPTKNGLPQKGFPFFCRVTEQLRVLSNFQLSIFSQRQQLKSLFSNCSKPTYQPFTPKQRPFMTWVRVKIKQSADRRCWSIFPLTRVSFGVPVFDPQPH